MAGGEERTLWQRLVARFSRTAADMPLPLDKLSCSRPSPGNSPREPVVLLSCGSFNPPTVAHLRMFELARDHLTLKRGCDVLGGYMSPVNDAYRKKGLAPARHRVAMAQAAVESSPFVMVDSWEAGQSGYQRSLFVLQRLQRCLHEAFAGASPEQPVRVMLLCGADLVESFAKPGVWKPEHLEAILQEHGVICISRGTAAVAAALPAELQDAIDFVEEPVANSISSSALRALLAEGRSVRYLTPDPVIDYIRQHRLYRL